MAGDAAMSAETVSTDRAARLARCLERAREGELSTLDEAVRELNPLLWQVARAQGLPAEEASDVVQTAWLELLRHLRAIRSPQALTAWLVTTTRREAWRMRARSRAWAYEVVDSLESRADDGPGLDELLLTEERNRVLLRHFHRLSEQCRELLGIVAEVDRPDYAVVAEALGMPRGSIGPTRGRCLAKLREMLLADPQWRAT